MALAVSVEHAVQAFRPVTISITCDTEDQFKTLLLCFGTETSVSKTVAEVQGLTKKEEATLRTTLGSIYQMLTAFGKENGHDF